MQEIPAASAPASIPATSTPTLSGMGAVGPDDATVKPGSLGRISLKKLSRNQARMAPAVERARVPQAPVDEPVSAPDDELFQEDDLDQEPLVGAYGGESTIINTDPDGLSLDAFGVEQGDGLPDATAVHGSTSLTGSGTSSADLDELFEDDWEDEPTEAFGDMGDMGLDTLAGGQPAPFSSGDLASRRSVPAAAAANAPPEVPIRPAHIERRKTNEVGDLPARPDQAKPRWGTNSPLPPPPQAPIPGALPGDEHPDLFAAEAAPRQPGQRPPAHRPPTSDLPDLPARPRATSGAFPVATSAPEPGDPSDLPGRPTGRPMDMGFFEQAAPPEALRPIGSVRLDRRTDEVPVEMELGDAADLDVELIEDHEVDEQVIEDDDAFDALDNSGFDAVPTDPSTDLAMNAAADPAPPSLASTPTVGDGTPGLAASRSAEFALSSSGPGPMIPGFGGPVVPDLAQPAGAAPAAAPPKATASTPTLIPPPPPPSAQATVGLAADQAAAPPAIVPPAPPAGGALVPPPPPDMGGGPGAARVPDAHRGAIVPPAPPTAPAAPPPGPPVFDQPGSNGAPPAIGLDPLETAGQDALVPLDSAGNELALPALEDLPPEPAEAALPSTPTAPEASGGPIQPIPSTTERSDALAAAITSELGDLPAHELPEPPPQPAARLAPPQISDDGIMVFVPDAPVAEGGMDEDAAPGPAKGAERSSAPSAPPREPIDDAPLRPLAKPQRRVAAGHGIAKKGEGGSTSASGGGSSLRLALLIAIPSVLIIVGVVVAVVLTR
jgi:hypothetical protein